MYKSVKHIRCPKCDGKIRFDSVGTVEDFYGSNRLVKSIRRDAPRCEKCGVSYIIKIETMPYIRIELEEI
ncbi:hypothetical protein QTH32_13365 [Clostridium perfringens]|nr:hypothetical protein [Clostridium perfringens]